MQNYKDERRDNYPRPESELYRLDIDKEIPIERRLDELDRMREVKEQKRTWRRTMFFCIALNLVLLSCAFVGLKG